MYTILEYGQCFLYLNNGGILGTDFWLIRLKLMPLYSCSWKMCKVPGEFQRDFCREWRMQLFVVQRENMMTHLKSQQHFNCFRLDSDSAHKVCKCTSNISLRCKFKDLSVKGLKTAVHIKCTSAQVHTVT